MSNLRSYLVVMVMMTLIASQATQASELKLTADWNGVKRTSAFPVTTGIPFARGTLTDPARVKLISDGQEVPLQREVLAWWPDKSVKWLLLDFQATAAQKKFSLRYGPQVTPAKVTKGIKAAVKDGVVIVDTGKIKFRVRPKGSGLIDQLSYGGKKVFDAAGKRLNFMDMIHTDSPADYHPMDRYITDGKLDPSRLSATKVTLEKAGPLHAVVIIDGKYKYKTVGSTIEGTDIKGDCPFRIRIHAYAGQSFLRVEHFFYYEGDGDHDFTRSLGLKIPLPAGAGNIRYIGRNGKVIPSAGPLSGLYQQSADAFEVWNSEGASAKVTKTGKRFEGVLDVTAANVGVAVGVKDFWQNAAKGLHADLKQREVTIYFWPPEAPPLDYRRHAREWSVGETQHPYDPRGTTPYPFKPKDHPLYRLASKGVGKTHYALIYFHDPAEDAKDILNVYKLFNQKPLVWAPPRHYAASLALGRYRERVPGQYQKLEEALDLPAKFWKFSQERFNWYGFWLYGQVCQEFNNYKQHGRWTREFGRWGWAGGDSVGRLAYALMLQAVRKTKRADLEFAEKYLYSVHDVCSTHTPAYPHHYKKKFIYIKGASHRHGGWPWSGPYCGARGSHPVGAKIYYFLTGEGHAKDILEEMTQLALKNPHGGENDGPLGINAQSFLYQWEATGDDIWRGRVKREIDNCRSLQSAKTGWNLMMPLAFGINNAMEEYMDLTGDYSYASLVASVADRCSPKIMKKHWTRFAYYRAYSNAYNLTGKAIYKAYMNEMIPLFVSTMDRSTGARTPEKDWPGKAGGPRTFVDANTIRDIPFALYSLHNKQAGKAGK